MRLLCRDRMLRSVACGLLMTAGFITSLAAQTRPDAAGHCDGLPWFGPKDSLNIAELRVEEKNLRVRVSAKGPELHLRLAPDPKSKSTTDGFPRVGWIRVFSCETGALVQSLEVQSACGPESFLRFFEVRDANFDGYLDIATLQEAGGLWGRQNWRVFSPVSGKFIANDFTKALSAVSGNGLEFDGARHNITVPNLTGPGPCGSTKKIYHVEESRRLVLIQTEDITWIWDQSHSFSLGCTRSRRELVNGQMQVMKAEKFITADR